MVLSIPHSRVLVHNTVLREDQGPSRRGSKGLVYIHCNVDVDTSQFIGKAPFSGFADYSVVE